MIKYEKQYWEKGNLVCGIDEVGRGPIAGPLVVCGVILPIGFFNENINDSKILSSKKREHLFDLIFKSSKAIYIEIINEKTIDQHNIYHATKLAMESIANRCRADHCLVDAMNLNCNKASTSLIKGDTKSISIAAASIIAKVVRDQIMFNFDSVFPDYDFKNNKGYPTKNHKEALIKHGYINIHRKSFNPIKLMIDESLI